MTAVTPICTAACACCAGLDASGQPVAPIDPAVPPPIRSAQLPFTPPLPSALPAWLSSPIGAPAPQASGDDAFFDVLWPRTAA